MILEIFKKDGTLRTRPPKKYACRNCDNVTSKPSTVKLTGVSFYACEKCGGSIKEREIYIEWKKRKSGQWQIEEEILEKLSESEKTLQELSTEMKHVNDALFSKSFSSLCYWGKLHINVECEPIKYRTKCT